MTWLDEKITKKLNLKIFKKLFQITKIEEFEIHSKEEEIEIPLLSLHSQRLDWIDLGWSWAKSAWIKVQTESTQFKGQIESA